MIAVLLGLAQASSYALVTPDQRPATVTAAINALRKKDAAALDRAFRLVEVSDQGTKQITAAQYIDNLSACQDGAVHTLGENGYVIYYGCPARRSSAQGCDSGDLTVILTNENRGPVLAVSSRMKYGPDCLPPAPPPAPQPVDPALANKFAHALVGNDQYTVNSLMTDETSIVTVRRYPGKLDIEAIASAKGHNELTRQFSYLINLLGRPSGVECREDKYFEFCRFTLSKSGRVLLAFLNTKGGKMHSVRFDFAMR